jgi:hypothetical protein
MALPIANISPADIDFSLISKVNGNRGVAHRYDVIAVKLGGSLFSRRRSVPSYLLANLKRSNSQTKTKLQRSHYSIFAL